MSGDNSFQMLYDLSWPSRNYPSLWSYTLDTLSQQDCVIGPCPKTTMEWNMGVANVDLARLSHDFPYCAMVDTCGDQCV